MERKMKKEYQSAQLPFMGQKRMYIKDFKEVLKQFPDDAIYIDLFGGSGLLSHVTKRENQMQQSYITTLTITGNGLIILNVPIPYWLN